MAKTKFFTIVAGTGFLALLLSGGIWHEDFLTKWGQLSVLSAKASANNFSDYVPPGGRDRIQRTDGAGSRGCPTGSFGSLTLLIPSDHVGLTATGRPTFSWYVSSASSMPMQFALVEPGVAKPLLVKQFRSDKSGIVQLELPQDAPELSVGKVYRWTVSLLCNDKRPSENIYVRSWIMRVANPTPTNTQMISLNSEHTSSAQILRQSAAIYAQSGIWYDTIATLSKAYFADRKDELNYQYFRFLLDRVGLSQVPISEPQLLVANE
ncbi:DUF928 domain-containing protein [Argonema antarcticum]|uniref:DUF928 domain-containing protein n=1 Tax=Argonema antarcticum TaxID=2942763 RepID=UPI0020129A9C|nr:DUF928 domain-containing protein [Argonema antarcticum]MCL1473204.1 DUF928 domain-containing protein [Argonema antarcticum A004/B2]